MPLSPPPVANERAALMVFLAQQRDGIRAAVHGLSEEQARATPVASSELSLAGLLKHLAGTERSWTQIALGNPPQFDMDVIMAGWRLTDADTVEALLADYALVQQESERAFAELDLDAPVAAPEAPWFAAGLTWSVRWVLQHLIQETARHAGHADILREAIDGKTMYELLAESGL